MNSIIRKGFLARCYAGEERAWKVFWLVYIPGAIAFNIILRMLNQRAQQSGSPTESYIAYSLFLLFALWVVISVWRCARNVDWRPMFYVARIWAAIGVINVFIGGAQLLRTY